MIEAELYKSAFEFIKITVPFVLTAGGLKIKGENMKNIVGTFLCLALLIAIIGCSEEVNPKFRVHNERSDKANVQIQTSGGNTININDVEPGQTTEYQFASEGNITATAGIQNESVSPSKTFFASKDTRYTIVIKTGNIPSLGVDTD
ncbi:MAG: hypothetical protein CVV23_17345 [Ignavibacteriae bacterium HGW-Ignavibacteriae-2]|nr:MAG: hypothetical protein CVV23_17345 [Ignavibacteriae bacterium HGW-Ignavibacteriae-2]